MAVHSCGGSVADATRSAEVSSALTLCRRSRTRYRGHLGSWVQLWNKILELISLGQNRKVTSALVAVTENASCRQLHCVDWFARLQPMVCRPTDFDRVLSQAVTTRPVYPACPALK